MDVLDDIIGRLNGLPDDARLEIEETARTATAGQQWIPNPGPQTEAFLCEADELFYGGEAGGGKSDLLIGLSLTEHTRSLILRRFNDDARGLSDRAVEVVGNRNGLNGTTLEWRFPDGRLIEFGGCQHEDDKQRYKGRPHSLIGFDEGADFTETQFDFITTWCRTTKEGERCRVVVASNPPTSAAGLWIVKRWGAWLDPNHPNPAKPGELRWYFRGDDGQEREVDGPGPYPLGGDMVRAKSRTFIRSRLADNPDLKKTDYAATLAALPEGLREAYRDGRFDLGLKDEPNQVIPTAWVREAQERWTSYPPPDIPMTMMAVDASGGGNDPMVISARHDWWFAPLVIVPGKDIPIETLGAYCAGVVVQHRRDDCPVVVDMGGGFGGSLYEHLVANGIEVYGHKGAESATKRTSDRKLGFNNRRSQVIWGFREALDPGQPGGSSIALPASSTLVADLTAPTFEVPREIKVISKEKLVANLGRSTDEGDAVVMCWSRGDATQLGQIIVPRDQRRAGRRPQAVTSKDRRR